MGFKKLIFILFIFVALNSFYQPVQINNARFRHTIVRQINQEDDNLINEFITLNKRILFGEFIALNIEILIIDKEIEIYNSS